MPRRAASIAALVIVALPACRRAPDKPQPPPASVAPQAAATQRATAAPAERGAAGSSTTLAGAAVSTSATPPNTANLAALEMGGHVESGKGLSLQYATFRLLDGDTSTAWSSEMNAKFPQEIVVSFLAHDSALVSGVTITVPARDVNPSAGICPSDGSIWPRDVEIWTSMDGPVQGFVRAAAASLPKESGPHPIRFASPIEARFVKVVVASNYGCAQFTVVAEIEVSEGRAAGYAALLDRHADLASLLSAGAPAAGASSAPGVPGIVGGAAPRDDLCALPSKAAAGADAHAESRNVLVISDDPEQYAPYYYARKDPESPAVRYFPTGPGDGRIDSSILRRVVFWSELPAGVSPALFVRSSGIDTVAIAQACDVKSQLSLASQRALVNWVADGHKLIIQDSDVCHAGPGYSFLPFPFATSNPGARGAASNLRIVENNTIVSARSNDPAFLDAVSWAQEKNGNVKNDLGDSNVVTTYDAHWCGTVLGSNANGIAGFVMAYVRYGKGIIVYDGLDYDQRRSVAYRQLVLRELLIPFNPDGLLCNVPLTPFVITTDATLLTRGLAPGQSAAYPIRVLSNLGAFKGPVRLSLTPPANVAGLVARFEPDTVTLGDEATSTMTVTVPTAAPDSWRMAVRGYGGDTTAALCLAATLPRTGTVVVKTELGPQPAAASQKNLLVILDLSGSMNLPLAGSTRIGVARQVLRDVLKRIPDDFNVGLRLYGHRFGSRQKETCTDSELVLPVRRLDRSAIANAVDRFRPRGETPLVYSVLQAVADLKSAGGGSVVLITDGEESCGGDFAGAAASIRQSGIDFRLSIVGFTLTSAQAQRQLGTLSSSTGGAYYAAQDGPALARALVAATISRFPYTVSDSSGAIVASGEADDNGQDLPPGSYTINVQAGDEKITTSRLDVAAGSSTTVRVVRRGDRFVLDRPH